MRFIAFKNFARCLIFAPLYFLVFTCALVSCTSSDKDASPERATPGITGGHILLGSSMALKGHAGYLGTQTLRGALSYIEYINGLGGIHGRKIEIIAYDDAYDPPRCLLNTQKLIVEDSVFALFCYVGTPTTVKVLPMIEEAKIPLLGMFTGANALRSPFKRYLINIRASYYQETRAAVRHLIDDLGLSRIAVFYQYDAYGFDGLTGTEIALKEFGNAPVGRGSYIRGTMDVEEGLSKIASSGAEAVVMIGTYDPCAKFIKIAGEQGFNPVFHNVSFVGADELARRIGKDDNSVVIMSQVVPPPENPEAGTQPEVAREYSKLLKRLYPEDKPNFVGFEGYINARVLVEGLKRTGKDLSRERFIDVIESIRDYSLGPEMTVSFSTEDHQGMERVYFTRLVKGRFILIKDWKAIKAELN